MAKENIDAASALRKTLLKTRHIPWPKADSVFDAAGVNVKIRFIKMRMTIKKID